MSMAAPIFKVDRIGSIRRITFKVENKKLQKKKLKFHILFL
jgi:hypothetical protein